MTIIATPRIPPTAQTTTFATVISPMAGSILKNVSMRRITTPAAALSRSLNPDLKIKNSIIQALTPITVIVIVPRMSTIII